MTNEASINPSSPVPELASGFFAGQSITEFDDCHRDLQRADRVSGDLGIPETLRPLTRKISIRRPPRRSPQAPHRGLPVALR
jgi:hypothetical protein